MLLDDPHAGPVAPDLRGRPPTGLAGEPAAGLRALFGLAAPASADDLPPELAFLVAGGVAPHLLHAASRIAAATGVTGEAALFGLGFSDERYHRLLARHLGVPYLHAPLPLAREGVDTVACAAGGWAPLAPNPGNVAHVLAPRDEALRGLLRDHRVEDVGQYGFAVTTRRRFEALLRRHDAPGLRERAESGLAGWDAALSARGGATPRQSLALLAFALAAAAGVAAAPRAAWVALSCLLFAVFAAAVAQRLLVAAAGREPPRRPPSPEVPDRDLPVYTVIVPLFREARVLPQLVRNLDALDYPALCRKRNKHHPMRCIRNHL